MDQVIFIVIFSAAFLCYTYFFDKKGFAWELQARVLAWFGLGVFGVILVARLATGFYH
ncbi:hypothetical protein [Serratia quinivorans]|uniref:hypothetical protein n=1 Tax=Serratia quinivorans TaxID=137545 RepID=UPI00142DA9F9|nr:hypothetical protein [Serratia quinivorans]